MSGFGRPVGYVRCRWCTAPVAERDATIAEGDEPDESASDNSLGRLLALSDGVFAIAMTLLVLDLRLPDLGAHASDGQLRHALAEDWHSYLAFLISFYVVANYWGVHRRTMRAVTKVDARLISHTLPLLLLVAALPFPASVLASYGDLPTALAFYSAFNVVANLALIRLLDDGPARPDASGILERERVWADILVLLLCIPGAFVLGGNGPWLLLLLVVSGRVPGARRARREAGARPEAGDDQPNVTPKRSQSPGIDS
jgi:TMEM175 potassium channel family protein